MKKPFSLLVLLLLPLLIEAQKIPLDHSVYDTWKSLGASTISDDGRWVTYEITPQQGDGWLYIYEVLSGIKDSVFCGFSATISPDSKYLVYQVKPVYAETRQSKKKKLKEDQQPKNNLFIRLLGRDTVSEIRRVKSYSVPEKGSYWMAYLLEKQSVMRKETGPKADSSSVPKQPADTSKAVKQAGKNSRKPPEPKGTELVIINPVTGKELRYPDVTEYVVARDGKTISFMQDIPDTTKSDVFKVNQFDTGKEANSVVFEGKGLVRKLTTDRAGDNLSFIFSGDTSKTKIFSLYLSKSGGKASMIIDTVTRGMPVGWSVSENGNISFSDDGSRLFFGTAQKPMQEPEDTLLDDEKYRLDIWSWNDEVLQPMQKKQMDTEKRRTYMAVYHIEKGFMHQLAGIDMPVVTTFQKGNNDIGLGVSNIKYRILSSWDDSNYADYYFVNIEKGTITQALEKQSSRVVMSPSARYLLYWDAEERDWIAMSVSSELRKNITYQVNVPLYNELNDTPSDPQPYGIAGWLDDEKHVLISDRYDIWSFDLTGKDAPVCITNGFGRKNNITFSYRKLDPDAEFIGRKEMMYLNAFNNLTKEAGFYLLKADTPSDPVRLVMDNYSYPSGIDKARNSDKLIWRKGSFVESPELYISDMSLGNRVKISFTNPQQSNYLWGNTELFEWTSFDRQKLQGILYKPENFDPAKKYPMIVYFYERNSDGLNTYIPPAPSASTVNRTFAVSNGYLVFVPDIPYVIGYPGQSCYDAVVSGTYALLDKFSFIDKEKIGLDGQSWGGYQIAYLVTRTDLFACAFSGAPVVNMISAYGGIRWGTGMSRMFQYEKSQSRIGGTLWEKPLHFIENSPIFEIPRISAPLLIMHNDADGAVPWYQGIEFITALRRLGKHAWLLSYNDEDHNLVKRPNRKDISIRKMQFFDHYLKGEPMPYWMKYGISQLEKGRKDGYELVEDHDIK